MPKKAFVYIENRGEGKGFHAMMMVERPTFKDYYGPWHLKNGRVWESVETAKAFLDKFISSSLAKYEVEYGGVLTDQEAWKLRIAKEKALKGDEQLTLFA